MKGIHRMKKIGGMIAFMFAMTLALGMNVNAKSEKTEMYKLVWSD